MKKLVGGLVAALLLTTACGTGTPSGNGDGHSSWHKVGSSDSYVFTICDHGNRVYWATSRNTDAVAVVPNAEDCG